MVGLLTLDFGSGHDLTVDVMFQKEKNKFFTNLSKNEEKELLSNSLDRKSVV